MATLAETSSMKQSDLAPLRKRAVEAVEEMFNRAIDSNPETPKIHDAKDEVLDNKLLTSGPLQDCEFGMAILLVRDWLEDQLFSTIDESTFDKVVIALIDSTVKRVLLRNQTDKGGGGDHPAFFTGEPY